MTEVISVKFKDSGKAYYFNPDGLEPKVGEMVIVEMQNGREIATVSEGCHLVDDDNIVKPLRKVARIANEKDLKKLEENKAKEAEALKICEEMAANHKLEMKLISAEYSFDSSKLVFFFTADGRVDFRELVKNLASKFHTRIELRQIGVRDEAKMLGGIGICGQPYCCKRFLGDFQTVSIKMAKEQGLSLNPAKVSGSCGRLMCCLKYEQSAYEYLNSVTPNVGATVKTPNGTGVVCDVNPLSGNVTVNPGDGEGMPYKVKVQDIKILSRTKKPQNPQKNSQND